MIKFEITSFVITFQFILKLLIVTNVPFIVSKRQIKLTDIILFFKKIIMFFLDIKTTFNKILYGRQNKKMHYLSTSSIISLVIAPSRKISILSSMILATVDDKLELGSSLLYIFFTLSLYTLYISS